MQIGLIIMLRILKHDMFFSVQNNLAKLFKILVGVFLLCDLHFLVITVVFQEKAMIAMCKPGLY